MRIFLVSIIFFSGLISCSTADRMPSGEVVLNDIHSKLNETRVAELVRPETVSELQESIVFAKQRNLKISISGGKHSMGGGNNLVRATFT